MMAQPEEVGRFALVDCDVTGHQHYGILFHTTDGRRGFIDSSDISDESADPREWPSIGERITCVVLGETRDGRLRASARASDVALVRAEPDARRALSEWLRIRDAGFADASEMDAYLASARGKAILKWAIRRRRSSTDYARAREILASAPATLRDEIE
jgi:predicted RNA-binding protein with RPS1 domain